MIATITSIALAAFRDESKALHALNWYDYAGRFCADLDKDHALPQGTAAGVVAALSPLNTWESQVRFTPEIIRKGLAGEWIPGAGFTSNKEKAIRILCGEKPLNVLGGDKVRNFYRNLTGDWEAVTIDRHAVNVAGWTGPAWDKRPDNKHYHRIAFAFKSAAQSLGLAPAECQALTWCYWRDPW